jgi:hypothetical protein
MPTLHPSTFEYLKPTDAQIEEMAHVRAKFAQFVTDIDAALPAGPDKTFVLRSLRDAAMWANVCLTRGADGSPRV